MNIEEFREYCLSKPGVTEDMPFGDETLVFKVYGKMFALSGIDNFSTINLKCDPQRALELRERYPEVIPGYHMNKKHWNTVTINQSVHDREIFQWIDDSYELVVRKLPRSIREKILKK